MSLVLLLLLLLLMLSLVVVVRWLLSGSSLKHLRSTEKAYSGHIVDI